MKIVHYEMHTEESLRKAIEKHQKRDYGFAYKRILLTPDGDSWRVSNRQGECLGRVRLNPDLTEDFNGELKKVVEMAERREK